MDKEIKEKTFTKGVEEGPQSWEESKNKTYNPLKDED